MKKSILAALLVCLLLTGCGQPTPSTTPTPDAAVLPTVKAGPEPTPTIAPAS